MSLYKYSKYLVYFFMVLYGLIGAVITGNDKIYYYTLPCENTLVAFTAVTTVVFMLTGLTLGCIQLTADYQGRQFDVIDVLDEHYYINVVLFTLLFSINLWGSIELMISSCASRLDMFHIATGLVLMYWIFLIIDYIFIPSLKKNLWYLCTRKKKVSGYSTSYYENSWKNLP